MNIKSKPNIIVFFTDQQRWDTSGLHGNPLSLMENFDHYAVEGTHLYNSFTCQPVCGPARASLQSGMYATKTGCYKNRIPLKKILKLLQNIYQKKVMLQDILENGISALLNQLKKRIEVVMIIGWDQIY